MCPWAFQRTGRVLLKKIGKVLARTSVAVGASVVLAATTVSTAHAAARDGHCDAGEFCLYWGNDRTESLSDFTVSIRNYGDSQPTCYEFKGAGRGINTCVKNNALSAWNRTNYKVTVYYNSGYGGAEMTYYPGTWGNFVPELQNNNASHLFRSL